MAGEGTEKTHRGAARVHTVAAGAYMVAGVGRWRRDRREVRRAAVHLAVRQHAH